MMRLTCCVCGEAARAARQWWNRDHGYGLCGACAAWLRARPDYDAEEFHSYYGDEGIHWFPVDDQPSQTGGNGDALDTDTRG